jgi:hypothetical protein
MPKIAPPGGRGGQANRPAKQRGGRAPHCWMMQHVARLTRPYVELVLTQQPNSPRLLSCQVGQSPHSAGLQHCAIFGVRLEAVGGVGVPPARVATATRLPDAQSQTHTFTGHYYADCLIVTEGFHGAEAHVEVASMISEVAAPQPTGAYRLLSTRLRQQTAGLDPPRRRFLSAEAVPCETRRSAFAAARILSSILAVLILVACGPALPSTASGLTAAMALLAPEDPCVAPVLSGGRGISGTPAGLQAPPTRRAPNNSAALEAWARDARYRGRS